MDTSLAPEDLETVEKVLASYEPRGIACHALRTRQAGAQRFVSVHILVPGEWSVQRGHELLELLEADIRKALPGVSILTHLEPKEDPSSFADEPLIRD